MSNRLKSGLIFGSGFLCGGVFTVKKVLSNKRIRETLAYDLGYKLAEKIPEEKTVFEFENLVFETRADAELVLEQIRATIDLCAFATVADLYELAEVPCSTYASSEYGWTDVRNTKIERIRNDGYIIKFREPIRIKRYKK